MNYNQYYGGQENYASMPNQPYYQSTAMSPGPPTPRMGNPGSINQSPQTNPMLQMNQVPQMNPVPQMNAAPQMNPIPQSNVPFQYKNNPAVNYVPPVSPVIHNPMLTNQYNMQSGMMNQVLPNSTPPNYTPVPTNPSQFTVMQQNPNSGVYPSSNVYNGNNQAGYKNMAIPQTTNVPGGLNNAAFTNSQQYGVPVSQQLPYSPNSTVQQVSQIPNTQVQPVYGGEPCNTQSQQNTQHATNNGKQEETTFPFKPTNVIGQYKCSDFPTLFTGSYRYPGSPMQRKPFTMRGEPIKPGSHVHPDRRSNIGLNKYGKRWELRGGKYYGCFTSRTNGLQDICPKAKCRLCPDDNKKK